jgi:hypothetical protein
MLFKAKWGSYKSGEWDWGSGEPDTREVITRKDPRIPELIQRLGKDSPVVEDDNIPF